MSKRLVVYGFNDIEFNSIYMCEGFNVLRVNSIDEGFKKSGLAFAIKEDHFNMTWEELDKEYRSKNKYAKIIIICDSFNPDESLKHIKYKENKQAKICNIGSMDFFSNGFPDYLEDIYNEEKKNKKIVVSERLVKLGYLIKIYDYIKDKKEVTITELTDKFSLNRKSVERYVNDLYSSGVYLGYDKKKRCWYYCGKVKDN